MNIGDNIQKIRKNKGIQQKQLAEMLDNMPVSTLANYENNHREPSIEMLNKIAQALEVNILNLIEDSNLVLFDSGNGLEIERRLTFNEDLMAKIIQDMSYSGDISGYNLIESDYTLLLYAVKNTIKSTIAILSTKNVNARDAKLEKLNQIK